MTIRAQLICQINIVMHFDCCADSDVMAKRKKKAALIRYSLIALCALLFVAGALAITSTVADVKGEKFTLTPAVR